MPELAFRLLVKAPFMVVLPSNHRLAALKSSGPSDLAGEPFVTVSNKAPALRAVIDNFLKRSGIKVMSVQEDDHLSLGLWLMASTGGMALVLAYAQNVPSSFCFRDWTSWSLVRSSKIR